MHTILQWRLGSRRNVLSVLLGCLLCSAMLIPSLSFATDTGSKPAKELLTQDERAWLKEHPVIRFSNEPDWPPFDFAQDGHPAGYSVEYVNLIAQKLGFTIEWVTAPWPELLQMAENKQIDAIHSSGKTEKRETFINFAQPYYLSATVLFTRPEDSAIAGFSGLKGKRLAVVRGFAFAKVVHEEYPDIEVVTVADPGQGLAFVSQGKADAYIDRKAVCQYFIKKNAIPNVVFASLTGHGEYDAKGLYMGSRKDWPEFACILDKGIAAVTEEESLALRKKWFGAAE